MYLYGHDKSKTKESDGGGAAGGAGAGEVEQEAEVRYLDFTSGIGVTNTGHCHPKVVQAIQQQASQLIFGQMNIVIPPVTVQLAHSLQQALTRQSQWPGLNRFFFSNSGAEAVEASIKLARHATGKVNVIVFQGSFHGRTHQAMAMTTAKAVYRAQYQPLPGGIFVAPFPAPKKRNRDEDVDLDALIDDCLYELETCIFKGQSRPEETAAMILEPVMGEGGYIPAPPRFVHELRRLCRQHGILFIADEVQSGMGRTGKLFSLEHAATTDDPLEPDILVLAKGLGSGLPISAIASRADLMDQWMPGSHGGTYGGGCAIASAAAVATLDVILNDGILENTTARGAQLITGLQSLQQQVSKKVLCDVRGLGLMVGTEFPSKAIAQAVQRECLARNMLLLTCGTLENVLRWIPPLVVTESEMDEALDIFSHAVQHVVQMTMMDTSTATTTQTTASTVPRQEQPM